MSEPLERAHGQFLTGNHKAALKLLWQEKVESAGRADADRLRAVIQLGEAIQATARGRAKDDAFLLVESATSELRFIESRVPSGSPSPPPRPGARPADAVVGGRLQDFERRLRALETELVELRALAGGATAAEPEERVAAASPEAPVTPPPVTVGGWEPRRETPEPAPAERPPAPGEQPPAPVREPWHERVLAGERERISGLGEKSLSDLVGARALAAAGGVVTFLGIVLFFVLAVNRGWVSPELRCLLGALASAAVYGFGVFVRRRYGNMQAALAAAGAGVGGAYATLVAASVLYDFVSPSGALVVASGIAAVGVATALIWNAQLTAGLGLVGAMLGPVLIEDDTTRLGAAFVAVVLAATVAVTLRRDWVETMIAGGATAALTVGGIFSDRDPGADWPTAALVAVFSLLFLGTAVGLQHRRPERDLDPRLREWTATTFALASIALVAGIIARLEETSSAAIVAVVAAFWLLYLGLAIAIQLRSKTSRLERPTTTFALASVAVAFWATHQWFEGDRAEGLALVAVAAVTLLPLLALRGSRHRDVRSLLWATGLTVTAVAGGYLLTGETLALIWAGQAALLSWLAVRAEEPRLQIGAVAYLVLAFVQTIVFEAAPVDLFRADSDFANGIPAVLFVAAGAAAFAFAYRRQPGVERSRRVLDIVIPDQRTGSLAAAFTSGALVLYAASFGLLELFQQVLPNDPASVEAGFERGQAALTALWTVVALALLAAAFRFRSSPIYWVGIGLFALAVAKVASFDAVALSVTNRSYALLGLGGTALAAGFLHDLRADRVEAWKLADVPLHPFTVAFVLGSAAALVGALYELLDGTSWGIDRQGAGLVAVAAVYGALAATVFRKATRRDLATLLWGVALVLAGGGLAWDLLDGQWLVLAGASGAAALAWLASRTGEPRFLAAAVSYLAPAAAYTLVLEAHPRDFFFANADPATGVPSVVAVAVATAVFAYYLPLSEWSERVYWTAGGLGVYAASLSILGFFQALAADDGDAVAAAFQRGHTGVSSFWGVLGLVLLAVGLRRRWTALRLAGLALFAVALAKIFLYDLSALSSMARALSFLGVGSVLLLAAFLYQRLTEERRESASG